MKTQHRQKYRNNVKKIFLKHIILYDTYVIMYKSMHNIA